MRRAKHSLPFAFKELKYNLETGFYDITQAGINYHLTHGQVNDVKIFFSGSGETDYDLNRWFMSLNIFERKAVKRSGDIHFEHNGFYPDE